MRRLLTLTASDLRQRIRDRSVILFALVFLALAILFVIGMGLFLLGANREQRGFTARHAHGGDRHGPLTH